MLRSRTLYITVSIERGKGSGESLGGLPSHRVGLGGKAECRKELTWRKREAKSIRTGDEEPGEWAARTVTRQYKKR